MRPGIQKNRSGFGRIRFRGTIVSIWTALAGLCFVFVFNVVAASGSAQALRPDTQDKPNVVWIMLEDWSTDLGCYGTKGVSTPVTDKLAAQGIRYTNAFCTSPVCSTSRSAMITGFHQNYIGAHQHRLSAEEKCPLPYGIKPMPVLLKAEKYPMLAEMNILNLQGKLNKDQSRFFAPNKPDFELYDIVNDPHELNNLANHPRFASIKDELLAELYSWRESIEDQGVSDEFRFGGLSSAYPTRTLEEWQKRLDAWKPWVFRKPEEEVKHPF